MLDSKDKINIFVHITICEINEKLLPRVSM